MKVAIIIPLLCLLVGCAAMAQKGALAQAYDSYEKRECGKVYKHLSAAESYQEPSPILKSEIVFLRSLCLEHEKKYDEALASYAYIIENFPQSEHAYRASARIESLHDNPLGPQKEPVKPAAVL